MNREHLDQTADIIREDFEIVNEARNKAYERSRRLISICARSIRAVHREEWETAKELIAEAEAAAQAMVDDVQQHPNLYFAGYTQDALKEYVEAHLTYALVRDTGDLPSPEVLHVEGNTWLNGLAEAATELRRRILDIIRHGHSQEAERLLNDMDDIYSILVTLTLATA